MSGIDRLIDRKTLRRMAGSRSFERGEEYLAAGAVTKLVESRGTVRASVQGTRKYRVALRAEGDRLEYECTCPLGGEGELCKHCVATALAWLDGRNAPETAGVDDVRHWLGRQEKETLVEMLLEQALEDDRLERRLLLAAGRSGGGLDLRRAKALLDVAVGTDDFVPYGEAHDYTSGILEALESVNALLESGRYDDALHLAEYAIEIVSGDLAVDDSDGYLGDVFARVVELHVAACRKAKPDPETLAARLLQWELHDDYSMFDDVLDQYERILGKKGIAAYRRLAEAEWNKLPPKKPGETRSDHQIAAIVERLARRSGDVEAIVAIRKRDLSSPYAYLQIAQEYRNAGNRDAALEWGEKGLAAFPSAWNDHALRELVADEYHARKRHAEAMALIEASFVRQPTLGEYQRLHKHAGRAGDWALRRPKALDAVRRASAGHTSGRDSWPRRAQSDRSELVRIFLWEGDVDAAWREAEEGGCSTTLWLELAAKRQKSHPEDALRIYLAQVEPAVLAGGSDYEEPVRLLEKARKLAEALHRETDFRLCIERLRTQHRRRRNLQKQLDRKKW